MATIIGYKYVIRKDGIYIKLMKSAMNRDEGFLPSDYDYKN